MVSHVSWTAAKLSGPCPSRTHRWSLGGLEGRGLAVAVAEAVAAVAWHCSMSVACPSLGPGATELPPASSTSTCTSSKPVTVDNFEAAEVLKVETTVSTLDVFRDFDAVDFGEIEAIVALVANRCSERRCRELSQLRLHPHARRQGQQHWNGTRSTATSSTCLPVLCSMWAGIHSSSAFPFHADHLGAPGDFGPSTGEPPAQFGTRPKAAASIVSGVATEARSVNVELLTGELRAWRCRPASASTGPLRCLPSRPSPPVRGQSPRRTW